MLFNELQIINWKKKFIEKEYINLCKYLDESGKNALDNFIRNNSSIDISEEYMNKLISENKESGLINAFYYVFKRKVDFLWMGLFDFLSQKYSIKNEKNKNLFYSDFNEGSYNNIIRQCRPDKNKYEYNSIVNIGFYNKNKNFLYKCYDDDMSSDYLKNEFSNEMKEVYNSITVAQAKSDFFLIASLYKEGGVSSDVCSICVSNISNIIKSSDISITFDGYGFNKRFLFSKSNNKLFKEYLYDLIEKLDHMGSNFDYNRFSSRNAFNDFILDFYVLNIDFFEKNNINFLPEDLFKSYVHDGISEEELSNDNQSSAISFKSLSKESWVKNDSIFYENTIVSDNYISNRNDNISVIGNDANPVISGQSQHSYAISSIDVVRMKNIALSGHACIWSNGRLINFETYLSFVAEDEYKNGFWKKPEKDNITRVIDDEVIIAFSAGYGCYGHYLVDDLPRLGAIKKHIGDDFYNKKFIIPKKTPKWAIDLLNYLLGIKEESLIFFDHENDIFHLNNVILSSFPSRHYKFHGFIKEFYDNIPRNMISDRPFKRICLSRKSWEKNKNNQRIFVQQDFFEEMATSRGFSIVRPETLPIQEQIDLMANTSCQVGEHGSAQHASVFNSYGMTIGTLNPLTEVQVNLGRIYNDKNFLCYHDETSVDSNNNYYFSIKEEKIKLFFDEIERHEEKKMNLIAPREMYRQ